MKNNTYMCLLRSSTGECEQPSASEMELQYAKYQAWQQKFADNILDMGNKLGSAGSVVRQESASDGPYIELKEIIGGYMMLTAATLDEAITVIKESPMVANQGTSIEIREICTP
ncbi:MAG: hypothetical protein HRU04_14110 [Oceanospirillaceae bacterium]|nr:hypothetical protein [Oceanospirillaceae bacterium]